MRTFRYKAKRGPHDAVEGLLEAENRSQAIGQLANLGYTPVRIIEEAPTAKPAPVTQPNRMRNGRVPTRHLQAFTRQFASLMRSQVPLLRALGILAEQTPQPHLRRILGDMAEDIRQGRTLSGALAKFPRVFSPLYVSLVRSGEIGGMLEVVLERLAVQAEREDALRAKVQSALAYPLCVAAAGIGTVVFLMTFVMPRLLSLFGGFGERLPLPTRLLVAVSGLMAQGWFWGLVGAGVFALALVWKARRSEALWMLDRLTLRLPLVGAITRQLELARFSRSFGLLLEHGVSILQAVEVAIPVVHHQVIRQELERLPARLKQGTALAACLKELPVVPPFVVNTVAVGEESGKAAEALTEVAHFYEQEAERHLDMAAALLEPSMILLVGALVGFIVMAVLLPIFELGTMAR